MPATAPPQPHSISRLPAHPACVRKVRGIQRAATHICSQRSSSWRHPGSSRLPLALVASAGPIVRATPSDGAQNTSRPPTFSARAASCSSVPSSPISAYRADGFRPSGSIKNGHSATSAVAQQQRGLRYAHVASLRCHQVIGTTRQCGGGDGGDGACHAVAVAAAAAAACYSSIRLAQAVGRVAHYRAAETQAAAIRSWTQRKICRQVEWDGVRGSGVAQHLLQGLGAPLISASAQVTQQPADSWWVPLLREVRVGAVRAVAALIHLAPAVIATTERTVSSACEHFLWEGLPSELRQGGRWAATSPQHSLASVRAHHRS
jgi:hypothetical protein